MIPFQHARHRLRPQLSAQDAIGLAIRIERSDN